MLRQALDRFPFIKEIVRSAIKSRTIGHRYQRRVDHLREAKGSFSNGEPADDAVLIDRLIASYVSRAEQPTGQWADIYQERHNDIAAAFARKDRARIEEILRNPVTSDILFGFDSTARSLRLGGLRIEDRRSPTLTLDALATFAEAIGAIPMELPENYGLRVHSINPEKLLKEIDRALGFEVPTPNPFPSEYGLATRRGVISYRVPQALYQAWRISKLLDGIPSPKVLEIGGGLGRTAFYARQFGIRDYTIVDIPVSSLAQGYFLGRTLGDDAISLFGEPAAQVKILPPRSFLQGSERYDLIINVDSLTEIGRAPAEEYWLQIKKCCDRFVSINHEANEFTVAQLIADHKPSRSPYWMRRGYVEEIVHFQ
jgi:hypothetical protein